MNERALLPVTLKWNGQAYIVPADQLLPVIAAIESILTLAELQEHLSRKSIPQAKVAMAYGAALRLAGCDVTDNEVYITMFPNSSEGINAASNAVNSVRGLIALMIPPKVMQKTLESTPGNSVPPSGSRGGSSKKHTRRG
jgi:hypothetical protein